MTKRLKITLIITLLITYFLYDTYWISREPSIQDASLVSRFPIEITLNQFLNICLEDPDKRKELYKVYPKETEGLSFYNSYWIFVEYGISLIRIDPIDIDPRKWSYGIVFDTRTPYSYYKALYLKQSNHRIKALIISCYIQNQLDPNIMQLLTGYLDEFNKREIFIAHNIIFTLR
jgi:hypothetical protein